MFSKWDFPFSRTQRLHPKGSEQPIEGFGFVFRAIGKQWSFKGSERVRPPREKVHFGWNGKKVMRRFGSNWKAVVNHRLRGRPRLESPFCVYYLSSVSLSEQLLILPDPSRLLTHFACKSSKRVTTSLSVSFITLRSLLYHFYTRQTLGSFMKHFF